MADASYWDGSQWISLRGPQGIKGDKGDLGPTGPAGPTGAASTVPGPQGIQGPEGPIGPAGPKGATGDRGLQGIQGPVGPAGIKGDKGDQGDAGTAGAQGPKGDKGDPGADGKGVAVKGTVANAAALPTGAADSDAYITANDGHLHIWSASTNSWINAGNIQGPAGPAGPAGASIPAGLEGQFFRTDKDGTYHWHYVSVTDLADVDHTHKPIPGDTIVWNAVLGKWQANSPMAHIQPWSTTTSYASGTIVEWEGRLWRARGSVAIGVEPTVPDGSATVWFSNATGKVTGPVFPHEVHLQPATLKPSTTPDRGGRWAVTYNVNDGDWRLWHALPNIHVGHGLEWTLIAPPLLGRSAVVSVSTPPFHNGPQQGLLWIFGLPGSPHVPVPTNEHWEPIVLGDYLASLADVDMLSKSPIDGDVLSFDGLHWVADRPHFPTGQAIPAIDSNAVGKTMVVHQDMTVGWGHAYPDVTPADVDKALVVGHDLRVSWKAGAIGPQGPAGATGPAGPAGTAGAAGAKGDKGDKGDTGSTGPQGPSVQSDWNEASSASLAFIKNKPTVSHAITVKTYAGAVVTLLK